MTALALAESRCANCCCPSERQQTLTANVVVAARGVTDFIDDLTLSTGDGGMSVTWSEVPQVYLALRSALRELDRASGEEVDHA